MRLDTQRAALIRPVKNSTGKVVHPEKLSSTQDGAWPASYHFRATTI